MAPRPAAPGRGPGGLQVVLLSREAAIRQEIPAGAREGALGKERVHLFIASVQGSPIERQRQHWSGLAVLASLNIISDLGSA